MQGAAVPGVSVGGCEVNGNLVEGEKKLQSVQDEEFIRVDEAFLLALNFLQSFLLAFLVAYYIPSHYE